MEKWLHKDLSSWWTQEDIYNYKFECRRYLDKVAGQPNREKINVFGTAAENCYLKGTTDSYIALSKVRKGRNLDEETDTEGRKEQDFETDFTETDADYATTDLDDETDATDTESVYQKVLVNGDLTRKFVDEKCCALTIIPQTVPHTLHPPDEKQSSCRQSEVKTNTDNNGNDEPTLEVEINKKFLAIAEPGNYEKNDAQSKAKTKSRKTKRTDNDTDNELVVDDM